MNEIFGHLFRVPEGFDVNFWNILCFVYTELPPMFHLEYLELLFDINVW